MFPFFFFLNDLFVLRPNIEYLGLKNESFNRTVIGRRLKYRHSCAFIHAAARQLLFYFSYFILFFPLK